MSLVTGDFSLVLLPNSRRPPFQPFIGKSKSKRGGKNPELLGDGVDFLVTPKLAGLEDINVGSPGWLDK